MRVRLFTRAPWLAVLASAGSLILAGAPASAQQVAWGQRQSCPPAPYPYPQVVPPSTIQPPLAAPPVAQPPAGQPPAAQPPAGQPPAAPEAAQAPQTDLGLDQQRFGGTGGETVSLPNMIGDQIPVSGSSSSQSSSATSRGAAATAVVGKAEAIKIAVNQNIMPQDRFSIAVGPFFDVARASFLRQGVDVGRIDIYEYSINIEKTLWNGNASIGLRTAIDQMNVKHGATPGSPGGDFAALGDTTLFTKFVLSRDEHSGSTITGGVGFTFPTGPSHFANAPDVLVLPLNEPLIQPYIGYRWISGDFFVHGFEELFVPTNWAEDVILLSTDVGVGYFLMRSRDNDRFVSAVAPTLEVHLNDPLNKRDDTQNVKFGVPDWLVLVEGVTIEFNRRSTLAIGVGEPLTGPRPYSFEATAQFNFRF